MIKIKPFAFVDLLPKNFETEEVVVLVGHLVGLFGYYNGSEIDFCSSDVRTNENFRKLTTRSLKGLPTYIVCDDEEGDYWNKLIGYNNNVLLPIFKKSVCRVVPAGFKKRGLDAGYIESALKTILNRESNKNMIVIMNPPYEASVHAKITKTVLSLKEVSQLVVLCPTSLLTGNSANCISLREAYKPVAYEYIGPFDFGAVKPNVSIFHLYFS